MDTDYEKIPYSLFQDTKKFILSNKVIFLIPSLFFLVLSAIIIGLSFLAVNAYYAGKLDLIVAFLIKYNLLSKGNFILLVIAGLIFIFLINFILRFINNVIDACLLNFIGNHVVGFVSISEK